MFTAAFFFKTFLISAVLALASYLFAKEVEYTSLDYLGEFFYYLFCIFVCIITISLVIAIALT